MPLKTTTQEEDLGFTPHNTQDNFGFTPTGLPSINQPSTTVTPPSSIGGNNDFSEFSNGLGQPNPQQRITPQQASDVYSPLLQYGGAAAGGAMAGPAAIATGPFAPAVEAAGGAAGFAIGSSLKDQLDQFIGLKQAPASVGDIAGNTAENLKQGTQLELGGRIGGKVVSDVLGSTLTGAKALAAKTPEALSKVSDSAAKLGINLTPAELLGTKSLSAVESILDNLPWTSGIIQKYRLGEMEKLNVMRDKLISENGSGKDIEELGIKIKNAADNYMQKLGTVNKDAMTAMKNRLLNKIGSTSSYEDLDISAKQAVAQYQKDLSDQVSTAYSGIGDKVDSLIGDQGAVPNSTLAAANKIIQEQTSIVPGARNTDLLRAAQGLVKDQTSLPPEILQAYESATPANKAAIEQQFPEVTNPSISKTYQTLDNNVKAFNIKKFSQVDQNGQITNAGRQWDDLIQGMKQDMQSMAESTGDKDLAVAHKIADDLYKKKLALFEDPAFKAINNKYPGAVSQTIYKSGNPELIDRYQALVGPELANKTKDRLTNDVLGLNSGDVVTGDQIRSNVLKLGSGSTKIYSPTELNYFQKLANAIDTRSGATNDLISNPFLKRMVSNNAEIAPSGIAKALITPQNSGAAVAIERQLGAFAKKKIADAFLPQLLSANQQGDFMPQTFAKQFDKFGKSTIEAWYGKDLANQLEEIATVGRNMGGAERLAGNPSGTARNLIGFYEGMRVLNKVVHTVASGFSIPAVLSLGEEGAMMLGTRELAKLYTSPAGRKLFVDGLMTPQTAQAAESITGRILSILGNEYLKKAKENQQ